MNDCEKKRGMYGNDRQLNERKRKKKRECAIWSTHRSIGTNGLHKYPTIYRLQTFFFRFSLSIKLTNFIQPRSDRFLRSISSDRFKRINFFFFVFQYFLQIIFYCE